MVVYRCEASTIEGFVQQLAVQYLPHGYWFYVPGSVPEGKDPKVVDEKLLRRYDVGLSKWAKCRRRKGGEASVQYLRFDRFFLILATHGRHRFFEEERSVVRDARRQPILFAGYAISFRAGHACVRIASAELQRLKATFMGRALAWSQEELERAILSLPFEAYGPVRGQLASLVRSVNWSRKVAGLPTVSTECIRRRRRVVLPFAVSLSKAGQGRRRGSAVTP